MLRREMLDERKRHPGVGGKVLQKSRERFETSGRCAYADKRERTGRRRGVVRGLGLTRRLRLFPLCHEST